MLNNASVQGMATKYNSGNYITETGDAKDRELHFSKLDS
jgi:hypothetical protein